MKRLTGNTVWFSAWFQLVAIFRRTNQQSDRCRGGVWRGTPLHRGVDSGEDSDRHTGKYQYGSDIQPPEASISACRHSSFECIYCMNYNVSVSEENFVVISALLARCFQSVCNCNWSQCCAVTIMLPFKKKDIELHLLSSSKLRVSVKVVR